jgi:hypothetical protein
MASSDGSIACAMRFVSTKNPDPFIYKPLDLCLLIVRKCTDFPK